MLWKETVWPCAEAQKYDLNIVLLLIESKVVTGK